MSAHRILIVEDRDSLRRLLERALTGEGYRVDSAVDGGAAIDRLGQRDYDLVLTDLKLPAASGLEVLAASLERQPSAPVVVLTAYGTVQTAVEAMKLGAADFLEKPVDIDDLSRLIAALLGGDHEDATFEPPGGPTIVGRHPTLRAALRLLERVAPTETTVLLTGPSGTGKELFARALHALSPRTEGPFVAVNCAALPESLLENELFGHEKGAFTGADRRQAGRFELAAAGTLLLDEVAEMSPAVQAKVLRVLEERTFERVGGGETLKANVRVLAATNRELRDLVEAGSFRADLFYRLDVFPIDLPALADRSSDVPLLARYLVARISRRLTVPAPELTAEAEEVLERHRWPGNVRQLANVLERAVILASGPRLSAREVRSVLEPLADEEERAALRRALLECDGDKRRAAAVLGVSYSTLQRRIKRHDLEGFPRYRDDQR